jgi:streptothricin hydrolase
VLRERPAHGRRAGWITGSYPLGDDVQVTGNARPVEALLIVDVQSAFVAGAAAVPAAAGLLEQVRGLTVRARADGALVVYLQNDGAGGAADEPGQPGWELYLPIQAGPREVVIRKTTDDGFSGTPLAGLLAAFEVRSLAVCGVMSEMCVSATARTALALGFRVIMAHDAHATYDIPPAPGISGLVPAAVVSRVAEWALGDRVEITARAHDVNFTAPAHQEP